MNFKRFVPVMIFLLILCFPGCEKPGVTKLWSTEPLLKVPESVMYDSVNDIIYVANINGKPTQKNKAGFISKISTGGKIETLRWVTGMNAPKGMGIHNNKLYVTDIDRIHVIDIKDSRIIKTFDVRGAQFLNDIAIDIKSNVYISDMNAKKIYILSKGFVKTWLNLNEYNRPNGLYIEQNSLLVGTAEGLLSVNLQSKKIWMRIPHKGGIDGLKPDGKGSYIISDWKGKTQLIHKIMRTKVLMDTSKDKINAADLEFIQSKKMILIPTFFDNRVVAYRLNN